MPKKPSLSAFRVNPPRAEQPAQTAPLRVATNASTSADLKRPYKTKAFELRPEAVQEFEILRAETGKKSYELAAEALNLLFAKYNKPQVG